MHVDLAIEEDLRTVFTAQLLNSDEDAVGRMLNHPHSIVSLSDAGAHVGTAFLYLTATPIVALLAVWVTATVTRRLLTWRTD